MRDQAIEAIARALPYRESGSRFHEAEVVLDALLDYLTEHADGWVEAAASAELDDAMQRGDHLLADVLLAVLR